MHHLQYTYFRTDDNFVHYTSHRLQILVILLLAMLLTETSYADTSEDQRSELDEAYYNAVISDDIQFNHYYIGVGLGFTSTSLKGDMFSENAGSGSDIRKDWQNDLNSENHNIFAGYNFNHNRGVEAQYIYSLEQSIFDGNTTVNNSAFGIYGVWKTKGDWYFKSKLGVAQTYFTLDGKYENSSSGGGFSIDESAVGVSFALGAGAVIGPGKFELMYLYLPKIDIDSTYFHEASGNTIQNFIWIKGDVDMSSITFSYLYAF